MTALAPEAAPMEADGTVTLRPLLGMVGRTPAACGDEDARPCFGEALARHRPKLLRYLRTKVGNEADAADLAQEACARMLVCRTGRIAAWIRA